MKYCVSYKFDEWTVKLRDITVKVLDTTVKLLDTLPLPQDFDPHHSGVRVDFSLGDGGCRTSNATHYWIVNSLALLVAE